MSRKFIACSAILFLLLAFSFRFDSPALAAPRARDCSGAIVSINAPPAGSTVSGTIAILGSASLTGDFAHYELHFSSVGLDAWVGLVPNPRTPVVNGTLGFWNTSGIPEGSYKLRVRVVDRSAQYCEFFAAPILVSRSTVPSPAPQSQSRINPSPTAAPLVFAQATRRPSGRGTPTPLPQPTNVPTPSGPTPTPSGVPTISFNVPTDVPEPTIELTPLAPTTARNAGQVAFPIDTSSIGASISQLVDGLRGSFVFGMQLTAGVFILLGAIVFLRHNL